MKGGQIMGQVSHLYDLFQPKHYQIYLDINREKKTFTGVTKISGNASQKEIALHQKFLNILDVKVNGNSTDLNSMIILKLSLLMFLILEILI